MHFICEVLKLRIIHYSCFP